MIIDCLADCHGHYPKLEGGDLLIIAGDLTSNDAVPAWKAFYEWVEKQSYKKIVYIAGNHDNFLTQCCNSTQARDVVGILPDHIEYLCDSGTEYEYQDPVRNLLDSSDKTFVYRKKIKIWGSPWIKRFRGMNKHCIAFTVDSDEELAEKWALIPEDTDILITHSPPYAVGDKCTSGVYPEWVGSKSLALEHKNRLKCKLHVFGHIHEAYCQEILTREVDGSEIILVNASHVNQFYQPVNKPIRIEL